jgi:hypothetical protein
MPPGAFVAHVREPPQCESFQHWPVPVGGEVSAGESGEASRVSGRETESGTESETESGTETASAAESGAESETESGAESEAESAAAESFVGEVSGRGDVSAVVDVSGASVSVVSAAPVEELQPRSVKRAQEISARIGGGAYHRRWRHAWTR